MAEQSTPEISIILIAGPHRRRGADALASLLAQDAIARAEIIVIDLALDRFPPLPGSEHPQVHVVQMGHEMHFGYIRAYATRLARAPLVAYLEEHALALPGWLAAILQAFARGEWAGVGGVILPADPEPAWGTMIYLLNFSGWGEYVPSGEVNTLPGYNTAYRRDALLALGDDLGQLMFTELLLQDQLRAQGYKLYLEQQCRWIHLNEARIDGLCFNYFCWNVVFGHWRVRGRSRAHQILRLVTLPLVLPVRMSRSLARVVRGAGREWRAYVRWMPYLLLIHLAETVGLGMGYLRHWRFVDRALTYGEVGIRRETPRRLQGWRVAHRG